MIRVGITVTSAMSIRDFVALAVNAERLGFWSIGVSDHLWPQPPPFIALTAAAMQTSTIRLATQVLNAALRSDVRVGREAGALQELSQGRLELGLGAGWHSMDWHRKGNGLMPSFKTRIRMLRETVTCVVNMLAHASCGIPTMVIGGGGPQILKMAAECADIVSIAQNMGTNEVLTPDVVPHPLPLELKVAAIRRTNQTVPIQLYCTSQPFTDIAWLRRWAEMGISYFVVPAGAIDLMAPVLEAL